MQGKVDICGINTAKLKVLKNEETMELIRRAQSGDQQAKEAAVMGNLRLVLSVVQRFSSRGEPMDDLFQVGVIGLLKAIDNFDTAQPVKFSTYGVPMIIGEIRRYLRDGSRVKISRSTRDNAYRALTAREQLMNRLQREPTMEEIAAELGLPREEVIFALDAISDPVSLYDPIFQEGDDSVCVMDQVRDERSTDENWLEQIAMRQAMEALSPREKRILALRFYDGKTQVEVSGEIGISQAQVSRLEKGVLEKIKRCMH